MARKVRTPERGGEGGGGGHMGKGRVYCAAPLGLSISAPPPRCIHS
jgi:hypothetical protein